MLNILKETGIKDMLWKPLREFVRSGKFNQFGKALATGTFSFFKKSISGVSNSINHIIGTIMKGLSTMTFDKEYL